MASTVKSPCIDICVMEDGVCTGCGMTNQELTKWSKMTDEERLKVIERIAKNKAEKQS
jgi:predicted Fe-S protein YdhL (DUF1289 family)